MSRHPVAIAADLGSLAGEAGRGGCHAVARALRDLAGLPVPRAAEWLRAKIASASDTSRGKLGARSLGLYQRALAAVDLESAARQALELQQAADAAEVAG